VVKANQLFTVNSQSITITGLQDRKTFRRSEATDRRTAGPSRRFGRDLRFAPTRPQDRRTFILYGLSTLWTLKTFDLLKQLVAVARVGQEFEKPFAWDYKRCGVGVRVKREPLMAEEGFVNKEVDMV